MKLFFLSLCLPVAAVACGGSPNSEKTASTASHVDGTGELGDSCGGFVANPNQCDTGANLYCKGNGIPDMPGTCASCDNFGLLPRVAQVCADGNTYSAKWVSTGGTCQIQVCPPGLDNGNGNSANQCQAPSDCTGFLPQSCMQCADGSSQCAHWDCNAGQCQTVTCDDNGGPASSGGGSANQCQAASDCSGVLPRMCMQCADGSNQCAHWDCNAGQCQTVTCDDNGGPASSGQ